MPRYEGLLYQNGTRHAESNSIKHQRWTKTASVFCSLPPASLQPEKLTQYDGGTRVPATICAIADSIHWAERIMQEIDRRWPAIQSGTSRTVRRE